MTSICDNSSGHTFNNYKNWWIKWVLIGLTVLIVGILLFIPLVFIFISAFSAGIKMVFINLINKEMIHAILLTIVIAVIAVFVNTIFGILVSWLISRFKFFGRQLLFTVLYVPIAVSPVVAGLLYLLFYTNTSMVGYWLDLYDIQVIFTWVGLVLVTIFVTFPFVANELIPLMISQGSQEDEAAILLGASGWMMFWHVTFPNIRWGLLYGVMLTNARAIGEFGAVSIVSGLIRNETYTLPLYIELLYQDYNTVGAFVAASLLALISIVVLCVKYYFQSFLKIE